MDLFLRHHDKYLLEYNCSFYSVEDVPLEQRTHRAFAYFVGTVGIITEFLYIPCVYALFRLCRTESSICFRLMLIMAIYDMLCLPVTTIHPAIMAYHGLMFCTEPISTYVIGIMGFTLWGGYCVASVSLALNRCLCFSKYEVMFSGNRQYFWCGIPVIYSTLIFFFARAPIYNSIYDANFFNPHMGYFDDPIKKYNSRAQIGNNMALSILLPSMYFLFYAHYSIYADKRSHKMSKKEKSLFLQVFLISAMLSVASFGYVLMQYVPIPRKLIFAAHLGWIVNQCAPPIIYLTMNRSIQRWALPHPFKVSVTMFSQSNERQRSPSLGFPPSTVNTI